MTNHSNRDKRTLSRREFLRLTAVATAGSLAMGTDIITGLTGNPAAGGLTENHPERPASLASPQAYKEAPMLAALVQQGRLPPVEERLPTTPCVIPVLHQTGKYDSVMNRAFKGLSDRWGPTKMINHQFVWYDKDLNLIPHLCESWNVNADASEWTFYLRAGTHWSDGVAFTADDIVWWYHNVLTDPRIFSVPPSQWMAGDQVMTIEQKGQYTIKMKFNQPNVLFMYKLARGSGAGFCLCPSHYMKRYHIDFTDDPAALEAEAAAAGFASWGEYYRGDRSEWYLNPDLPDLGPWLAKNTLYQPLFVMERNPYFYGVDADDNQLPYVDTITHNLFSADDDLTTWIKNGVIDFQARHTNFAYYDEYKEGEATGGYQVVLGVSAGHVAIQLNMTTLSSARLREFFQDLRVRRALSLAVNRTYLNTQFYAGLATPRQYSPLSTSPQYNATLSGTDIAYDVAEANALLDDAGYTAKDGEGFRLWKDGSGERISFTIEGTAEPGSADGQAALQVIHDYATVGIEATYQKTDLSLIHI